MSRKIVLLEANEIPYRVLDDYVASHPNGALARRIGRCQQYTTRAADTCRLSPWITWPTLHRGVNNEVHQVVHFGQDLTEVDRHYPPIWRILADAGISTGVFGPLHSWPLPKDAEKYDYYLPDTFAETPDSHPNSLTSFQNFNLVMARQSPRNVSGGIDFGSLLPFILKAPGLGLRLKTLMSVAKQLVDERREGWKRTRRRTYQPVLAFDLFMKQLSVHKPQFTNFFTNHVASAMHRYWAAAYPGDYDVLELTPEWQAQYGGEIDFAMGWLDDMFERLTTFMDRNPEYLLVVASSMGQHATDGSRIDSQLYLRDPGKLMERIGLGPEEWQRRPAMDPDISMIVSRNRIPDLVKFFETFTIRDKRVKWDAREEGFLDLSFGQANVDPDKEMAHLDGQAVPFSELGLEAVIVEDEAGSTAYHVPDGTFYIYDPQDPSPKSGRPQILTTQVAPALLEHFGITPPDYMEASGALRFG